MAKGSGLGSNLWVDGYNISGDVGSLSKLAGPTNTMVSTGIDKLAYERLPLLRDGEIDFTAFFNGSAGQAHPVLSALPTADRLVSFVQSPTLGGDVYFLVAKQVGYDPTRGNDGSLTISIQALANGYGAQWGKLITAGIRTDVTATSPATGYDQTTASTAFGWQATLHVFGITGTSATMTLADSADNSSFANLTGGAFTAATGPTSQVLFGAAGATVRRYIRVSTTGMFTSAIFGLTFVRNLTAVTF